MVKDAVDKLLEEPANPRRQCLTCLGNEKWGWAVDKFHKAKLAGAAHSWTRFFHDVMVRHCNYPHTLAAFQNHVRNCLKWREKSSG